MLVSDALFKTAIGVASLFILLAVSVVPVRAGNYFRYDDDVQGKVIDADTQQPLEGVVVMAMWVTEHTRITIEPEERYYDYFETLTDANGEFTIPGKGRNIFRNMPPPKITIYKAGYPIRDIRFSITSLTPVLEITFEDGKRIISYQKWPAAKRKEYVKRYRPIPFYKMSGEASDKYRLYSAELDRDYQALGIHKRQQQNGVPLLIYQKGGVYPATNQPVSPRKSK
jgi:hypothetical protein